MLLLDVHRDIIICICSTSQIFCLCICIQIVDWTWFIPDVTLNWTNVVVSNLMFIGNAIFVPSKHQIDLILAYN